MLSSIIGHEDLKPKLAPLVTNPGIYLFHGPSSIGKRTIALELSRYILCKDKKDDGCGCPSCAHLKHPDLLCIGQSGKILVNDVEQTIVFCSRYPLYSGTKVVIIDTADNISSEAANRLLKIIEESSYTFFLITSEIKRILPTILSRCMAIKFQPLSQENIANILISRLGFDPLQARILGWLGASTSMDIFANAGKFIQYKDMAYDFISGLKDLLGTLDFIDRVDRKDLPIFIDMVVLVLTDILVLKNEVIEIINSDKRAELTKIAKVMNDKGLVAALGIITQVKRYMYLNINLNLAFKNTMIKTHPLLTAK